MNNADIVKSIRLLGTYEAMTGEKFKAIAYDNAAMEMAGLEDLKSFALAGKLTTIRGIGGTIESKVLELIKTGRIEKLERFKKDIPVDVEGLMSIEGVGPRTVYKLFTELGVKDPAGLKKACEQGKLASIKGMGGKLQTKILANIALAA